MITDAAPPPVDEDLLRAPDPHLDARLDDLQREIHEQGDSLRTTGRNFSIFAVLALVLSFAMLIAVAAKLDSPPRAARPGLAAAPARVTPVPAGPAALPSAVTEKLTEMRITASAATVAAGRVRFTMTNAGSVAHELVILKTATPAAALKTNSAGRADETGNVGETGDMAAAAVKTITVHLAAGHYALICNLPGHYQGGMYADLTVR